MGVSDPPTGRRLHPGVAPMLLGQLPATCPPGAGQLLLGHQWGEGLGGSAASENRGKTMGSPAEMIGLSMFKQKHVGASKNEMSLLANFESLSCLNGKTCKFR